MRHQELYSVQWRFLKQAAFGWLTTLERIKHTSPQQVVIGSAVMFLLVCKRFGLNPREVLDTTDRIVRRSRDVDPEYVRGIEQYLKEELKDG